jgi:hypothetical protein
MNDGASAQTETDLNNEFRLYVENLKAAWLRQNQMNSRDVFEVMRPEERAKVHGTIRQWERYITPLVEAWWKERGYGVTWPDHNLKPMQVHKLVVA